MEFELPKINVSFEYDEEKDEIVFVINGVEKRVKTEDMITEMEKLQEQNTALEQQPCEDCISREYILSKAHCCCDDLADDEPCCVDVDDIKNAPSVQPKPIECEDCISRKEVIQIINDFSYKNEHEETLINERIKNLPSIQPKPKTGHWIISPNDCFVSCSECGLHGDKGIYKHYRWCPNCGARMVEPQERSDKE